jgi:hypothetical protein
MFPVKKQLSEEKEKQDFLISLSQKIHVDRYDLFCYFWFLDFYRKIWYYLFNKKYGRCNLSAIYSVFFLIVKPEGIPLHKGVPTDQLNPVALFRDASELTSGIVYFFVCTPNRYKIQSDCIISQSIFYSIFLLLLSRRYWYDFFIHSNLLKKESGI